MQNSRPSMGGVSVHTTLWDIHLCHNVEFQKISIPPLGRFFVLHPPPLRKFQVSFILASKNFNFEGPVPQGISDDLPWRGHGCFKELHYSHW